MEGMFHCCIELKYIDLSNFNNSNVINMAFMLNKCYNLNEIIGINRFKTNNVTNMERMFQLCKELEYIDLSNFDNSNVTNMAFMFNECTNLKKIKGINKFITTKVTDMKGMF